MCTYCKIDYCKECPFFSVCGGCKACDGHPMGGNCIGAEIVKKEGFEKFAQVKNELIKKINSLEIEGLHIEELYMLLGKYANLAYPLPNKETVKFLNDNDVYFGCQVEREGNDRCLGVTCNTSFILISEYSKDGKDPVLIKFIKL